MQPSFELFDHTADVGIRVRAPDLSGLIQPAAAGLYAVIGNLVSTGESFPWTSRIDDGEPAFLLRDFLGELLLAFETDRRILAGVDGVEFADNRLTVSARLAPVDEQHSEYHREVKAVTYHELSIRPIEGGYEAVVIVDI